MVSAMDDQQMNGDATGAKTPPQILPYRKWPDYFKYPSSGTLKYLLLRRKGNGFDKCVRRISGRLYLDVRSTLQFLDSQRDE